MALRFLLDTSICIYFARQRPPAVEKRLARLAPGMVGMSLITFGELRFGAEKSVQRTKTLATLGKLIELIPVLVPDAPVGERYGTLRAPRARRHTDRQQ